MTDQRIYQIGLTMIPGVGNGNARTLLKKLGSAAAVFTEKQQALEKIHGISHAIASAIQKPEILRRAEQELKFIEQNAIQTFFTGEANYPVRLGECQDAPVLFYFKGDTNLQTAKVLSIGGTRNATEYGKELLDSLIRDLAASFPDLLIVSGLAYGIDIYAHRKALQYNLPTVGVLAHGLDRIYPAVHRETAVRMLQQGGLLTDFPTGTNPDRQNFVCRNRIVAGLSDATLVVESADKGGSLITADIAFSYGRDVFAFPGRTTDRYSIGCNELIRQNKAGLISNANDLIMALCWDVKNNQSNGQTSLIFTSESDEDLNNPVLLQLKNEGEMHMNQLAVSLNMPVHQLSAMLFELEMEGKIKSLPGNRYKRV